MLARVWVVSVMRTSACVGPDPCQAGPGWSLARGRLPGALAGWPPLCRFSARRTLHGSRRGHADSKMVACVVQHAGAAAGAPSGLLGLLLATDDNREDEGLGRGKGAYRTGAAQWCSACSTTAYLMRVRRAGGALGSAASAPAAPQMSGSWRWCGQTGYSCCGGCTWGWCRRRCLHPLLALQGSWLHLPASPARRCWAVTWCV